MLILRVLSALVGIPLILVAVYYGGPWYAGLIAVIAVIAVYEFNNMFINKMHKIPHLITYPGVLIFIAVTYFDLFHLLFPLITLIFLILFSSSLFRVKISTVIDSAIVLWGIVYIGFLLSHMIMLRLNPEGMIFTYILLGGVWIHDTLAYFVGSKWGINKMAPDISPKKSVEGSLAGIIGTVIVFISASILYPQLIPTGPILSALFALGLSVFAQLGDLMESAMKRKLEVKDAGSIIPGHGGVLDRFDSLMVAAPFAYYFLVLFG